MRRVCLIISMLFAATITSATETQSISNLGALIEKRDEGLYVRSLLKDGVGYSSGLRAGDRVVTVDGKSALKLNSLQFENPKQNHTLLVERGTELKELEILAADSKEPSWLDNVNLTEFAKQRIAETVGMQLPRKPVTASLPLPTPSAANLVLTREQIAKPSRVTPVVSTPNSPVANSVPQVIYPARTPTPISASAPIVSQPKSVVSRSPPVVRFSQPTITYPPTIIYPQPSPVTLPAPRVMQPPVLQRPPITNPTPGVFRRIRGRRFGF